MKKLSLLLLLLVLTIVAAACGAGNSNEPASTEENTEETTNASAGGEATEITITHKLGETTVAKNPGTVVVFDFGVLDTLDKLGVEVAAVPQGGTIPAYLSKYEDTKYVNAGGLKEPDFETIAGLAPDLIIISDRQLEQYEEFTKIGPTIHMGIDYTRYMDSYKENSMTLGEIFNKEAEVDAELAKVDEAIKALNEQASATGENALVILANAGNLSAYGPSSRFGLIHDVFGLAAADENIEVSAHGQNVSFEYIVEKDPDYLFVVDRDAVVGGNASAKQTVENELIKDTKAFKNGNIIYLDPNYWYLSGGGLVSVAEMVKAVEEAIQ